jgi:hypothetical protein
MAEQVSVAVEQLAGLAVEHWRLSGALSSGSVSGALVRHSLRKMEDVLKSLGLEARSLDGMIYDPGLNVRVVDKMVTPVIKDDTAVIAETVAPLVLFGGRVVKTAEVVLAVGEGK